MPTNLKPMSKTRIIITIMIAGVLLTSTIATYCLRPAVVNDSENHLPIFWFVYLSAILGCTINESQRNHAQISILKWHQVILFICWKVLVAITFAVFLYVACASGIIGGDLFPQFQNTEGVNYTHMLNFLKECKPTTNQDVAKVLVWSFIAGYSEKFVPNIINGICSKLKESK